MYLAKHPIGAGPQLGVHSYNKCYNGKNYIGSHHGKKNVDGAALLVALFSRGFVQLRDTVVALD